MKKQVNNSIKVRNSGWEVNGKPGPTAHYVWTLATQLEPLALINGAEKFHPSTIRRVEEIGVMTGVVPNPKGVPSYINSILNSVSAFSEARWASTHELRNELQSLNERYVSLAKKTLGII
jgi:hypothetical protein